MTYIHDALEVIDLNALTALDADSTPPRIDRGIYYVRDAGAGLGRWAQYLAGSTAAITSDVLMPDDSVGRWILAEGASDLSGYQPLDSDLSAIAALTTTAYGRGFLPLTNEAAALAYLGAAPASHNHPWSAITGTPTTLAGYGITDAQPLDSDLSAIAALATTSYGRGLLTQATFSNALTYLGAAPVSHNQAWNTITGTPTTLAGYGITNGQPLNTNLTAIAALAPALNAFLVGNGSAWTALADSAARTALGLSSAATATLTSGTWTPSYVLSTSGSVATNIADGVWIQISNWVFFGLRIRSSSISSPTGNVSISLPFAANSGGQGWAVAVGGAQGWGPGVTQLSAVILPGATDITLYKNVPSDLALAPVLGSDLLGVANRNNVTLFGGYQRA